MKYLKALLVSTNSKAWWSRTNFFDDKKFARSLSLGVDTKVC